MVQSLRHVYVIAIKQKGRWNTEGRRRILLLVSIITNSCTHCSVFIKNTLKVHVKFTSTCFGSQMEPSSEGQQLILAKVYKWFNGAGPYSQYCGGIRKPMCVCTARCTEGDCRRESPSVYLAVHTHIGFLMTPQY